MGLSKRIKELRIKKGLTQTDLSEKSGISLRTIQRIENDEVSPSIYSLKKLSKVLDEDLNSFNNPVSNKKPVLRRTYGLHHLIISVQCLTHELMQIVNGIQQAMFFPNYP